MYPAPAQETFSISLKLDLSMALTRCSAKTSGFWLSFFASSKHNDEANCPYSMFGVLFNVMVGALISGKVFFRAFASEVWHSWRNWSNGFSEIIVSVSQVFGCYLFELGYILNVKASLICLMDADSDENKSSLFRKMFRLWHLAH